MRRGAREIFFVCSAIIDGSLANRTIAAASPGEASKIYSDELNIVPQEILGPFYKKKTQVLETNRNIKLSSQIRKAIYNDWYVKAFILKEPEDYAYLVFIKRVDDKKLPAPKGVIVVPINDLRMQDE